MSWLRQFFGSSDDQALSSEGARLEIEYCTPLHSGPCKCCGGLTTTLNRLVKRDGLPYAMCRITFAEEHPEEPARAIVGIGEFGEGTEPHQWIAFGISLKPEGIMIIDATRPEWVGLDILGLHLTREQALRHPHTPELFRLVDQLYLEDGPLREFFAMVAARAEPGATLDGGPDRPFGNPGVNNGPPSVS